MNTNPDYKIALGKLKGENVVNDHAERDIALIKEYIEIITRYEPQFQLLNKIVKEFWKHILTAENWT